MTQTLLFRDAVKTLDLPGLERNLFSCPEWMEVLWRTYGLNIYVKYIEREGRVSSYILYSTVNNFLEKKICICSYSDYCDGFISQKEDWQIFFEALRCEYPDYRIAIRNLRDCNVRENPNFKELSREFFHILDLQEDVDTLWKKAHVSFRNAVRQAQRANVSIKICPKEDLKKFYSLHLGLRKNKYRLFPQPYKFFDNIWEIFMRRDRGILLGAFDPQGKLVAGTIYLMCGNTFYYKFNTSSIDSLKLRPNNLLFWEGIKIAKERKMEYLDLGSSGYHQKGLILFKNHTGAHSQDIVHLGFHPENYKFSQKRILKTFTSVCTVRWMPDFVTRMGSHLIYPFLA